MRAFQKHFPSFFEFFLILFAVSIPLFPVSPLNTFILHRDSGVFTYIGWRILNGQIPYLNIWDHKPPLIYFIDALGLALTPNSQWGILSIQFIFILVAAYIGFKLIKSTYGKYSAIFSLFIWLLTLVFLNEGGNLTEEYALPFQFGCLLIISHAGDKNLTFKQCLLIGLLSSICFFFKQTNIGILIAIILYLIIRRIRSHQFQPVIQEIVSIFVGFLPLTLILIGYFFFKGALIDFWNCTFIFNFRYVQNNPINYILLTALGLCYLLITGFLLISLTGFYFAVKDFYKKKSLEPQLRALLIVCVLDFPIELILAGLSGRGYKHYFISILPCLTIFAGLFFNRFSLFCKKIFSGKISELFLTIFCLCIIFIGTSTSYENSFFIIRHESNANVIPEIEKLSSPQDSVLFWGAEAGFNYMTRRVSPTKYVYQIPLYICNSHDEIESFLKDIIQNKPKLIVDTKNEDVPFLKFPVDSKAIEDGIAYIKVHYRYVEEIQGWTIYKFQQ